MELIDKAAVLAAIEGRLDTLNKDRDFNYLKIKELETVISLIESLEVKEVNVKKESELIANAIMIGVQYVKYHTVVYNMKRCDFNHSHLMIAAEKGIELGLKLREGKA